MVGFLPPFPALFSSLCFWRAGKWCKRALSPGSWLILSDAVSDFFLSRKLNRGRAGALIDGTIKLLSLLPRRDEYLIFHGRRFFFTRRARSQVADWLYAWRRIYQEMRFIRLDTPTTPAGSTRARTGAKASANFSIISHSGSHIRAPFCPFIRIKHRASILRTLNDRLFFKATDVRWHYTVTCARSKCPLILL